MKNLKITLTDSKKVQDVLNLKSTCNFNDEESERLEVLNKTNISVYSKELNGKTYELGSIETKDGLFIEGIIFCEASEIYRCSDVNTWNETLKNF
jgi:hypothetical protein